MKNIRLIAVAIALVVIAGLAQGRMRSPKDDLLPQEVAEKFLKAYNAHDAEALVALYAEDVKVTVPDLTEVKGREEHEKYYKAWFKSVPDITAKQISLTVDGDRFVLELRETGTYTKALPTPGSPKARGQKLAYPYVMIGKVKGGLITTMRIYENDMLIEKQLKGR